MKTLLVKNTGATRIEYLFETVGTRNTINHRSTRGRKTLFNRTMEVTADFGNKLYKELVEQGYARFSI